MTPSIRLVNVDASNWRQCVELRVSEDQRDLICSNDRALAEAGVVDAAEALAIYHGGVMVGVVVLMNHDRETEIHRFMIDQSHQRQGLGREALLSVLNRIRLRSPTARVVIKFLHWNSVAEALYRSVGFVDTNAREGDEKVFHLPTRD